MDVREDKAWLMRNRFNPFPVSGILSLSDAGITFVLDTDAAEASLGWLEDALEIEDLQGADRIWGGGRRLHDSSRECEVTWPITAGGSMMVVATPNRRWVVSHDYPTGGAILQTLNVISGRGKAKAWKKALAKAEQGEGEG